MADDDGADAAEAARGEGAQLREQARGGGLFGLLDLRAVGELVADEGDGGLGRGGGGGGGCGGHGCCGSCLAVLSRACVRVGARGEGANAGGGGERR